MPPQRAQFELGCESQPRQQPAVASQRRNLLSALDAGDRRLRNAGAPRERRLADAADLACTPQLGADRHRIEVFHTGFSIGALQELQGSCEVDGRALALPAGELAAGAEREVIAARESADAGL